MGMKRFKADEIVRKLHDTDVAIAPRRIAGFVTTCPCLQWPASNSTTPLPRFLPAPHLAVYARVRRSLWSIPEDT